MAEHNCFEVNFTEYYFKSDRQSLYQKTMEQLLFLVGAFEERCPTLTVGMFVRRVRSSSLFICLTT